MSDRRADQTEEQPPRAETPAADERPEALDGRGSEAAGAEAEPELEAETGTGTGTGTDSDPAKAEPDPDTAKAEAEPDPDAAKAEAEPDPDAEVEPEPEDELAVAQRERAEYLALAQRAQADFENYRKRAAKEAAAAQRRAKTGLIGDLLPVVDNLERALVSAGEQEEHLAGGVRLVHSDLVAVLARNGVEQFDPAGEKFDPSFHEALSTREQEGADAGVVVDVVEKGYSLNGTVLRPARVVVSG